MDYNEEEVCDKFVWEDGNVYPDKTLPEFIDPNDNISLWYQYIRKTDNAFHVGQVYIFDIRLIKAIPNKDPDIISVYRDIRTFAGIENNKNSYWYNYILMETLSGYGGKCCWNENYFGGASACSNYVCGSKGNDLYEYHKYVHQKIKEGYKPYITWYPFDYDIIKEMGKSFDPTNIILKDYNYRYDFSHTFDPKDNDYFKWYKSVHKNMSRRSRWFNDIYMLFDKGSTYVIEKKIRVPTQARIMTLEEERKLKFKTYYRYTGTYNGFNSNPEVKKGIIDPRGAYIFTKYKGKKRSKFVEEFFTSRLSKKELEMRNKYEKYIGVNNLMYITWHKLTKKEANDPKFEPFIDMKY